MYRTTVGQKKQVGTVDDYASDPEIMLIGVVHAEDEDWFEAVNFGKVPEVILLDTRAQCNVLPKAALMTRLQQSLCSRRQHDWKVSEKIV